MSKKKLMDTNDLDMLARLVAPSDNDTGFSLGNHSSKNSMAEFFRISESATEDIGEFLTTFSLQLAVAESCTGGLLGSAITQLAGVSTWFNGGFLTYTNELKEKLLGVDAKTLETYGAVSALTVCQMATGAAQRADAQVALSISGIAGPSGATENKPVGTVWIGLCIPTLLKEYKVKYKKEYDALKATAPDKDYSWIMSAQLLKNAYCKRETPVLSVQNGDVIAREFLFEGDRTAVRQSAVIMALYFLYEYLTQ